MTDKKPTLTVGGKDVEYTSNPLNFKSENCPDDAGFLGWDIDNGSIDQDIALLTKTMDAVFEKLLSDEPHKIKLYKLTLLQHQLVQKYNIELQKAAGDTKFLSDMELYDELLKINHKRMEKDCE